jgi:6-pyruvoyltetrahydropterin/6-carboxytetrahydropterin synthase
MFEYPWADDYFPPDGDFMFKVTISESFSAAHALKEIGGKRENLHGHNFKVEVTVAAPELNEEGILVDFRDLKKWIGPILEDLDHHDLSNVSYFKDMNPSSEHVSKYIFDRLAEKATAVNLRLVEVIVCESENARVSYSGEDC